VNAGIPDAVPAGAQALSLSIAGKQSNTITVIVAR
jgi:hypothetical protein